MQQNLLESRTWEINLLLIFSHFGVLPLSFFVVAIVYRSQGQLNNNCSLGSKFFFFQLKLTYFQSEKDVIYLLKVSLKQMSMKAPTFKPKKDSLLESKSKRDTNMDNVRIVQKNLVFVSGLPGSIADADLLKTDQFFGRYGKVTKVVTNLQQHPRKILSYQAYVTYQNTLDAAIAITALDGFNFQEKPLKVSFGTTKYCAHFLRGYQCLNPDCFYLHDYDRKNEVLNKDTKTIFQDQNQQAMDIVCQNKDQIAKRIIISGQQIPEDGFPSLMEMMEFLIQSKVIQKSSLQNLLKKHKDLKIPKLVSSLSSPPVKTQIDSPKQTVKLTKSNSFSTVGSPTKSQTETESKIVQRQRQKQKQKQNEQKQKKTQNIQTIFFDSRQIEQKTQRSLKAQKKQNVGQIEKQKVSQIDHIDCINQTNRQQQQVETAIQKQFLKLIFKLTDKSKSKMQFAGQPQWTEVSKIKEIVQKHLIISI